MSRKFSTQISVPVFVISALAIVLIVNVSDLLINRLINKQIEIQVENANTNFYANLDQITNRTAQVSTTLSISPDIFWAFKDYIESNKLETSIEKLEKIMDRLTSIMSNAGFNNIRFQLHTKDIKSLQLHEIVAMSFNIRLDTPIDAENRWDNRRDELLGLIQFYNPDFVGLQEVLHNQLVYLDTSIHHKNYIGVGRDDGKEQGEYSPIFYNHTRFELRGYETFWLSETPDTVSTGWDAALPRICTYGLFFDKSSGDMIYVFNTHFDHVGELARIESAKLIVSKIEKLAGINTKVILMGDFNCEPNGKAIEVLNNFFFNNSQSPTNIYGPVGTFNAFNTNMLIDRQIDFIFSKNFDVLFYQHVDDRMKNNNFISDHLPVLVKLY